MDRAFNKLKPKYELKLYNAAVGRKEYLNAPKIGLFSPLLDAATWRSHWLLGQFASFSALRAYFVADWVRRMVKHSGRPFQLVDLAAHANLNLVELDAPSRGSFCLEVAPFVAGTADALPAPSDQNFGLDVVRYYAMSSGYRAPLQWNTAALTSSQAALARLRQYASNFETASKPTTPALPSSGPTAGDWRERFYASLNDDLNLTRALAVIWTMLQDTLPDPAKLSLLREFDQLLGLQITSFYEQDSQSQTRNVPLQPLTKTVAKSKVAAPAKTTPKATTASRLLSSTREVRSLLDEPDKADFTVSLLAYQDLPPLKNTLESVLHFAVRGKHTVEVIVAALGADKAVNDYLSSQVALHNNLRVLYANPERFLGVAAGRNLALRQGRGKYLLLLETGLVLQQDIFESLLTELEKINRPALYGLFPLALQRQDGKIIGSQPFTTPASTALYEAEALDGAVWCFRRNLIEQVGFLDERFRYPFALDLDYSFAFRDKGMARLALPALASLVKRPIPIPNSSIYGLSAQDKEYQNHKNWQLFLKSWSLL